MTQEIEVIIKMTFEVDAEGEKDNVNVFLK
jgi:hypothetical protein